MASAQIVAKAGWSRARRADPFHPRAGGRRASGPTCFWRLSKHGERIALDQNLQHLLPGRPSIGPPLLSLDRPVAHAPLAAAPIDDDLDVLALLERPAEPIQIGRASCRERV